MTYPKIEPKLKTGKEVLTNNSEKLEFCLLDFWKWGMSDVLTNTERGMLAEFIVATAVGFDRPLRNDWDAYDLTAHNGCIKIEVKSAAYIQVWEQKKLSDIVFGIGAPKTTNIRPADIYVFCLLKHKDQETIDPLKMEQWEYYVVPTTILNEYAKSKCSITLNSLQKLTKPVSYSDLKNEIYLKSEV